MDVYLEVGAKRAFAVAVDWPGWARAGRDADAALAALVEYGPRYRQAVGKQGKGLKLPTGVAELNVVERIDGNAGTDFGVPGVVPALDQEPVDDAELDRLLGLLQAAWATFTAAADGARRVELEPAGRRGGGRSVAGIREHVSGAEGSYARGLGGRPSETDPWPKVQAAFIEAARARNRGELPDVGPRGGKRWPARYAIRRSAWHALDHAWEIEDRLPR